MPELKLEEAKKDLEVLVEQAEKHQETLLPETERKALEEKQRKEQEAEAARQEQEKKDTELLARKPEELSEEEKKRVDTIAEEKRKAEEAKLSAEEKVKRAQEATQKRIDEIVNELKQVKDKSAKEIELLQKEAQLLRQENETLAKKVSQPEITDPTAILRQKEQERLSKYLEEDAGLPKERRREMSREELMEWREEDPVAYDEWISERTIRRARERATDVREVQKNQLTKDFSRKWEQSDARVIIRHPELDTKTREAELKAQGKTDREIHDALCQENEKYRLCSEILKEKADYIMAKENGPELLALEMERRLAVKSSQPIQTDDQKRIEELAKKVEELEAQLQEAQMTDTGINSTIHRQKQAAEKLTEQEGMLVETMKSARASQADIDAALKNFRAKKEKG